jgi:hypothetical protein
LPDDALQDALSGLGPDEIAGAGGRVIDDRGGCRAQRASGSWPAINKPHQQPGIAAVGLDPVGPAS